MADGPLTPEDERQYQALRADFLAHARAALERLDERPTGLSPSPAHADALVLSDMEEPKP
jgi:hypothetical protein